MKTMIVGIAIIIIFTFFNIFQFDTNLMQRQQERLKFVADDISNAGSLYYDKTAFGNGRKVFVDATANVKMEELLKMNLKLNNSFLPLGGYWKDTIKWTSYFFDDTNTMRVYQNGISLSTSAIVFPYLFTEPLTGYVKLITEPTVIVTINAGKPQFRLPFLTKQDIIRTSAYEYF